MYYLFAVVLVLLFWQKISTENCIRYVFAFENGCASNETQPNKTMGDVINMCGKRVLTLSLHSSSGGDSLEV